MTQIQPQIAFSEVVGGLLRYHRKSDGVAQRDLAAEVGLSTSSWSRAETGQGPLTITQFRAATQALGLDAWRVMKQAEELSAKIPDSSPGFEVVNERPGQNQVGWFLGGAAVGALVATLMDSKKRRRG